MTCGAARSVQSSSRFHHASSGIGEHRVELLGALDLRQTVAASGSKEIGEHRVECSTEASASLISDDRDHHLLDLDRTAGRLHGRIPRSQCDRATIVAHLERN